MIVDGKILKAGSKEFAEAEKLIDNYRMYTIAVSKSKTKYSQALVDAAKKEYPKLAGKTHGHHPVPVYMGGASNQVTIPIDAAYHQKITNEFRKHHAYGLPRPTDGRLQEILDLVYSKFPLPPGY